MDQIKKTLLDSKILRLRHRAHKSRNVLTILDDARLAIEGGRWTEAEKKYTEALKTYTPPVSLSELLARYGVAPSVAQARRLVESGIVRIDGDIALDWKANIRPEQKVTVRGEPLQLP